MVVVMATATATASGSSNDNNSATPDAKGRGRRQLAWTATIRTAARMPGLPSTNPTKVLLLIGSVCAIAV